MDASRKRPSSATARNRVSCCMLNSKATSDSQLDTIVSICGVMASLVRSCCSRKPAAGHRVCSSVCSFLWQCVRSDEVEAQQGKGVVASMLAALVCRRSLVWLVSLPLWLPSLSPPPPLFPVHTPAPYHGQQVLQLTAGALAQLRRFVLGACLRLYAAVVVGHCRCIAVGGLLEGAICGLVLGLRLAQRLVAAAGAGSKVILVMCRPQISCPATVAGDVRGKLHDSKHEASVDLQSGN